MMHLPSPMSRGFAGKPTNTSFSAGSNRPFDPVYPLGRKPDNSVRVGVIGYGYWGSKHVRVLAGVPGVELTVIEKRWDRLAEAVASFPGVGVASCLDDVQDVLDAV